MNSNVQIKVLQIRLKNGAYIDAENGSAYDCSGQMIAHLTPKSLEVLRCIAKHSISPAKGILAAGIATTEILNTVWSKSSNKSGDKNSVAQEVFKIRTCLGSIYPGIPSTRILSAEQGDRNFLPLLPAITQTLKTTAMASGGYPTVSSRYFSKTTPTVHRWLKKCCSSQGTVFEKKSSRHRIAVSRLRDFSVMTKPTIS